MQTAGVEIPDNSQEAGVAALAAVGLKALTSIPWTTAEPLLAEMMACVQYDHGNGTPLQRIMDGDASQIEDVKTRVLLRVKVFELHTGFSMPASPLTSG
jgi:hypothetical protein